MRGEGRPIVALTAYDALQAGLVDRAGADMIVVGDSVALFALGRESTLGVTLDEMIHHVRAVVRSRPRALVVADLPYMSYEPSHRDAIIAAGRLMKEAGADGVKMPLNLAHADTLRAITTAGIPVLAHLVPSTLVGTGVDAFEVSGGDSAGARAVSEAAAALEEAGAFAILLETVAADVAGAVRAERSVPVLGFGSGPDVDGQVMSSLHVLGLAPGDRPPFMREYADLRTAAHDALARFHADVVAGRFPAAAESPTGSGWG
jgi:3-methyl-2-oxobutanoate hydroxymethyltransferase